MISFIVVNLIKMTVSFYNKSYIKPNLLKKKAYRAIKIKLKNKKDFLTFI